MNEAMEGASVWNVKHAEYKDVLLVRQEVSEFCTGPQMATELTNNTNEILHLRVFVMKT